MGSISIEGYVRPPSPSLNIIINTGSGGVSKEELNELINNFNSLDSNSVDVDSATGISIKISKDEDNILRLSEDGLEVSLEWVDVQ